MGIMIDTKAFIVDGNESDSEQRNEEEKVGLEKIRNINAEDFFIKKSFGIYLLVYRYEQELKNLSQKTMSYENVRSLVEKYAPKLWTKAKSAVQRGSYDDRPLYWARIKMEVALKNHLKGKLDADIENLIQLFEEKSRNYTGINFSKNIDNSTNGKPKKKILITGFDPFGLDVNKEQSNPSGAVALALHGTEFSDEDGNIGEIQAMIFPVRYEDFDSSKNSTAGMGEGVVEKYIRPLFDEVDMIVTISQSLPECYHIDTFATATRGGSSDNKGYTRPEGTKSVSTDAPETLPTTLPSSLINGKVIYYGKYFLTGSEYVLFKGVLDNSPHNCSKENIPTGYIYYGPGGNYLSNEIFYRVSLLRENWIAAQLPNVVTKPTGHFHVAMLQETSDALFDWQKTKNLVDIVRNSLIFSLRDI